MSPLPFKLGRYFPMLQLDIAVLQYQNQKLTQKLEIQKLEYTGLENKFCQLKVRQQPYDSTSAVVEKSWEQVIRFSFLFLPPSAT